MPQQSEQGASHQKTARSASPNHDRSRSIDSSRAPEKEHSASARGIQPDVSLAPRQTPAYRDIAATNVTSRNTAIRREFPLHRSYVPVILMRSSSGSRCRISSGNRSWTRRAPCLAASSIVTGAGVATATPSQISADSANPTSAPISNHKACRGPR